jgi:hypothetical protein
MCQSILLVMTNGFAIFLLSLFCISPLVLKEVAQADTRMRTKEPMWDDEEETGTYL